MLQNAAAGDRALRGAAFDDVLTAARAGAGWAFERLYNDLAPTVAGYLRLRGAQDFEDLTNEVFIGVFRGLGDFEGDEEGFRSWVFTIAHRRMIDDRRRRSVRPQTTELEPERHESVGGHAEDEAVAGLEDEWVRSMLDELTEDQRDVILMRILGDMSIEETAEALGKKPGAIKQLQRRGLEALRRNLETEGVTP
jgi:RNA polymerase sigma factor (sigma-70 family)